MTTQKSKKTLRKSKKNTKKHKFPGLWLLTPSRRLGNFGFFGFFAFSQGFFAFLTGPLCFFCFFCFSRCFLLCVASHVTTWPCRKEATYWLGWPWPAGLADWTVFLLFWRFLCFFEAGWSKKQKNLQKSKKSKESKDDHSKKQKNLKKKQKNQKNQSFQAYAEKRRHTGWAGPGRLD